ncbi:MAG: alpha/beta fold hydrolase [Bacteroidetes bacterium]|nr:MAG: alpha/beta fold hydrolase [Bacteroidota bacterium]
MKEKIVVNKTARIFKEGNEGSNIVVLTLHGYGHSAEFFIRKFSSLYDDFLFIAPEGLHRFYLNGTEGRVGASWMTKTDREDDISDNILYLDKIIQHILDTYPSKKIILLGFSQGGATAARWFYSKKNQFVKNLIMWATVFPPDIDENLIQKEDTDNYFVLGNEDQYYKNEAAEKVRTYYRSFGFKTIDFQGDHDINSETLEGILSILDR